MYLNIEINYFIQTFFKTCRWFFGRKVYLKPRSCRNHFLKQITISGFLRESELFYIYIWILLQLKFFVHNQFLDNSGVQTVFSIFFREAAKNGFFSGSATKRGGGGVRAWPLRKNTVFWSSKKTLENILWPLSSRGGGKALVAGPLTCGFPYCIN